MMSNTKMFYICYFLIASNWCYFNAMKRFSLRLTEAEYIKLKIYCEKIQLSMNDVVRQLIREWSPDSEKQCKICKECQKMYER